MPLWLKSLLQVCASVLKSLAKYLVIKRMGKKEAELEQLQAYTAEQEKLQGLRKEYERIDANSNRTHSRDPIVVRLRELGLKAAEDDKQPK